MSDLRKPDWAIDAVARRFSASWEPCKGSSPAGYLIMSRRRIAVDIAVIGPKRGIRRDITRPRLRFDRVALGFIRRVREALAASVPEGRTIVVSVTAPIRMASKTAAVVGQTIRQRLERRSARLQIEETINGNQIRARLAQDVSGRAAKVVGYVHNPDSDPQILFDITESLLRHVGAAANKRMHESSTGDRWLILACDGGLPHSETYEQVLSQLAIPGGFEKLLLVLPDGRVESLGD